jgi:hypothetical protein
MTSWREFEPGAAVVTTFTTASLANTTGPTEADRRFVPTNARTS